MTQKNHSLKQSGIVWLWLAVLIVVLDQVTKYIVTLNLAYYEFIPVLPVFNLTHVHNYGAAFSFLSGAGGWQRWFFAILALVASILMISWLKYTSRNQHLLCVSLVLILGGALGNLIDRLVFGYVIDFLDFYWSDYHFPAFNVADVSITFGAFFMVIYTIWFEPKEAKQHNEG